MQTINQQVAEQFAERFLNTLNEGALCLMASIGHRTGLFDAMAETGPATSQTIADAAALNERYVREWLGAMVTGGFVELDPEQDEYSLPLEHAAFLTREATPDNMAVFAQYIPLLGGVEDDIVRCFKEGGGVPYSRFTRFHEVMAEDSGQTVLSSLEDHILPLAAGIQDKLTQGIKVLDLGCGRGKALIQLAQRYPKSEFVGMDLSEEAIDFASRKAQSLGLNNIRFETQDLTHFDKTAEENAFDFVVTFDAVHDQAKPQAMLNGIHKTLRDDGVYLMQDIHSTGHVHSNKDHPLGPLLYTISTMHCMTVSLAQGGDGLGTMWGREKAYELLGNAGFTQIDVHQLEHDVQNDYYVIRK